MSKELEFNIGQKVKVEIINKNPHGSVWVWVSATIISVDKEDTRCKCEVNPFKTVYRQFSDIRS